MARGEPFIDNAGKRLSFVGQDLRVRVEKGRLLVGLARADGHDHPRRRAARNDERLESIVGPEQGLAV